MQKIIYDCKVNYVWVADICDITCTCTIGIDLYPCETPWITFLAVLMTYWFFYIDDANTWAFYHYVNTCTIIAFRAFLEYSHLHLFVISLFIHSVTFILQKTYCMSLNTLCLKETLPITRTSSFHTWCVTCLVIYVT